MKLFEEHNYCKYNEFQYDFSNINSLLDKGIEAQDTETLLELFEKIQANSNDIFVSKFKYPTKKRKCNKKSPDSKSSNRKNKKYSKGLSNKNNKIKLSKPHNIELKKNLNTTTKIKQKKKLLIASKVSNDDLHIISNYNEKDYLSALTYKNALTNTNVAPSHDNSLFSASNNYIDSKNYDQHFHKKLSEIENAEYVEYNNDKSSKMVLNHLSQPINGGYDQIINSNCIPIKKIHDYDQIAQTTQKICLKEFSKNYDNDSLKFGLETPTHTRTSVNNARILSQDKGGRRRRRDIRGEKNVYSKIPSYYTIFSRPPRGISKAASHTNIDWGRFTDNYYYENCDDNRNDTISNIMDKIPNYHSCFTNSMKYSITNSSLLHEEKDIPHQFTKININNSIDPKIGMTNYENNILSDECTEYMETFKNQEDGLHSNFIDSNVTICEKEVETNDILLTLSNNPIQDTVNICDSNNNGFVANDILNTKDNMVIYSDKDNFNKVFKTFPLKEDSDLMGLEMLCNVALNHHTMTTNNKHHHNDKRKHEHTKLEYDNNLIERKIIYIGRIENELTKDQLQNMFQQFGPILDCSVHFREYGENYGFVTFENSLSACLAVQESSNIDLLKQYDICFGGRRKFCMHEYFDLDGRQQLIEDLVPASSRRQQLKSFDELLREASAKIRTQ